MKNEIFIQTNYKTDDPNLASYGCNFLTLCKIAQGRKPKIKLTTKADVLAFSKKCQEAGIIDSEYFVNSSTELLKTITGTEWKQLSVSDSASGVAGAREWIPINYPVPEESIQIACYRKKDNFKSTHFSEIKTKAGETFSSTNVFNTLGEDWLERNKGIWYASDKRVYVPVA